MSPHARSAGERALAARDYPGFGYMVSHGEGSLWERWEGGPHTISGSRNHIMLGSPGQWMFQSLAGVSVGRGRSGRGRGRCRITDGE